MLVTTEFSQEPEATQTTRAGHQRIVQLRNSMFRLQQTNYGCAHRELRSVGMELHIQLERLGQPGAGRDEEPLGWLARAS